jgi:cytoskeleton protein RodZ
MEKRRHAPIEPDLTEPPILREVGEPDHDPLPNVCITLRQARLRAGYDLSDVANVLRIQLLHLEALEEGRFDELPGKTYAVGFLRSYAGFLGLDADDVIAAYKRELALDSGKQQLTFPGPAREGPRPRPWLFVAVLVLAGLAYGGWQYYASEGRLPTDLVADVSSRLTEAAGLSDDEGGADAAASADAATAGSARTADTSAGRTGAEPATPAIASFDAEATNRTNGAWDSSAAESEPTATVDPVEPQTTAQRDAVADELPEASASAADTAGNGPGPAPVAPRDVARDTFEPATQSVADATSAGETSSTPAALDGRQIGDVPQPITTPLSADRPTRSTALGTEIDPSASRQVVPPSGPAQVAGNDSLDPEPQLQVARAASGLTAVAAETDYVPQVFGRSNVDARVVIKALSDSWVQVQGPNNELLLTRILRTGDTYRVPDRPGLVMVTGNAGALEISVDGESMGPVGPIGVVRRNVALDPDRLVTGSALN